jgi:hypothetical protein
MHIKFIHGSIKQKLQKMKLLTGLFINIFGILLITGCTASRPGENDIPSGQGIAWLYPGDEGIENHPSVVFADNFESGNMDDLRSKWGHMSNRDGKVISFSDDVPEGSAGKRSLQMTATRGENAGGELYKTFDPGWDTIYLRFDTKFAEDHGVHHHFVALRGFNDPLPYPTGGAGSLAENFFSVTIEPANWRQGPPGMWHFYAYWPEMRSWQTPEGKPDGRPGAGPYYGNSFRPENPVIIPRGKWFTIEYMLIMNTSLETTDGEVALWIDGKSVVHFAPGIPKGYWRNDSFRNDPDHTDAVPFEGFRWRHDMDVKINVLRLQHYISGSAFDLTQEYSDNNPGFLINTEQATVWFDNVVMAREYIGPVRPR